MKSRFNKWFDKLLVRMLTLLGFSSSFVFMACYAPPPDEFDYLDIYPSSLHFPAEGGSEKVSVHTESQWNITNVPGFVNVYPTQGKGNSEFTITAMENFSISGRTGAFYVQGGKETVSMYIQQVGKPYTLSVSPDSIILSYQKGQIGKISVLSNGFWKITDYPSFVKVDTLMGDGDKVILVSTKSENTDSVNHTGYIVVNGTYKSVEVLITQKHK